jgi:hypothetical protein
MSSIALKQHDVPLHDFYRKRPETRMATWGAFRKTLFLAANCRTRVVCVMLLGFVGVKRLIFAYGASIGVELALHTSSRDVIALRHELSGNAVDLPRNKPPLSRDIFKMQITQY